MDPFTIALLGSTALSAGMTLFGGGAQAKQAAAQAQQARIAAFNSRTKGMEIGDQAQQELHQMVGNIMAVQSARGVDLDSPTNQALIAKTQTVSARNEGIQRYGALAQAAAYDDQARGFQTTANLAIPLAIGQAGVTIGKGAQSYFGS